MPHLSTLSGTKMLSSCQGRLITTKLSNRCKMDPTSLTMHCLLAFVLTYFFTLNKLFVIKSSHPPLNDGHMHSLAFSLHRNGCPRLRICKHYFNAVFFSLSLGGRAEGKQLLVSMKYHRRRRYAGNLIF